MIGLIGKKVGMTQIFGKNGKLISVTAVEAGPCPVIQVKTAQKDGYDSILLGFGDIKPKKVNKPLSGIYKKNGIQPKALLKEFRVDDPSLFNQGQFVKVDLFQAGEKVDIRGRSKGKGFAGVVKRWGFSGGKQTHGVDSKKVPGSIGACASPGRVWKGKKLPGRMGDEFVSVRNLEIVKVDPDRNLLLIKGSVPGIKDGYLFIKRSGSGK